MSVLWDCFSDKWYRQLCWVWHRFIGPVSRVSQVTLDVGMEWINLVKLVVSGNSFYYWWQETRIWNISVVRVFFHPHLHYSSFLIVHVQVKKLHCRLNPGKVLQISLVRRFIFNLLLYTIVIFRKNIVAGKSADIYICAGLYS